MSEDAFSKSSEKALPAFNGNDPKVLREFLFSFLYFFKDDNAFTIKFLKKFSALDRRIKIISISLPLSLTFWYISATIFCRIIVTGEKNGIFPSKYTESFY